jgi:hypothetical protein
MKIRFVHGTDIVSKLIVAQEKTAMPFTPSHVEAVTPEGLYLGAHYSTGVEARQPGYDRAWVTLELILSLPAAPEQDASFYSFLHGKLGEPYDWSSIFGFLAPGHHHNVDHAICSALISLALRHCGWFASPLAAPAHLISPRDLLLVLSGRVLIPM